MASQSDVSSISMTLRQLIQPDSGWLDAPTPRRVLWVAATACAGLAVYGFTVGFWRDPVMGVYVAVKLPLLVALTLLLVTLQMTTSLRPILGTAPTLLTQEKKFFLQHWGDNFGEMLVSAAPPTKTQPAQATPDSKITPTPPEARPARGEDGSSLDGR